MGEGVFKHESGIHTAAIAIHPAIYQFIAEEAVGGEQRFVFGKHSGAAAVESVLAKHVKTLHEHGVEVSPELVKRILDRVKSLREETLPERGYPEAMDAHYRQYYGLGLSEERIVERDTARDVGRNSMALSESCRRKTREFLALT